MKNLLFTLTLLTAISPVCAGIFHETDEEHTRVTGRRKMHVFHGGKSKEERHADREERVEEVRERRGKKPARTVRKTTKTTTTRE